MAYAFFDTPAIPADLLASSNWRFGDMPTDDYGHGIAEIGGGAGCGAVVGGGMLTGMNNQYDVIVVGGGHNGLVAAIVSRSRRRGLQVGGALVEDVQLVSEAGENAGTGAQRRLVNGAGQDLADDTGGQAGGQQGADVPHRLHGLGVVVAIAVGAAL